MKSEGISQGSTSGAARIRKLFELLIPALFIVTALYLAILLYTGGRVGTLGVERAEIATPVIFLSVFILLRYLLKQNPGFSQASVPIILFCCFHILYMANYRTIPASDTVPGRYLPISILREADFDLDEFQNLYVRGFRVNIAYSGSHYVSSYPVGASILATPFYLFSVLGEVKPNRPFILDLEKLAASSIVALSAVILYLSLRRLTTRRLAAGLAIVYALGTSSFSVSSQALWQHGSSQLAIICAIYCIIRGRDEPHWIAYAGFPCAFSVVCRPVDLLIAIPMSLYVLVHHRRSFPKYVLFALPAVTFQILYNMYYFQNAARTQFQVQKSSFWVRTLFEGLPNILLSPGRGLFIYSPVFLFSLVGIILIWRRREYILLRYLSAGTLATMLMYSKYFGWWGGFTYGPRLLADITPILALCLLPIAPLLKKSKAALYIFIVLGAFSIAAHANGAFFEDGTWNASVDINRHAERNWNWGDNQLINTPKRWVNRSYIRLNKMQTSRTSPEAIEVSLKTDLPSYMVIFPSKVFWVRVEATNTSKVVWLSTPYRAEGTMRVHWNWKRAKNNRVQDSDSLGLRMDIFPGEKLVTDPRVEVPDKPGEYIFEMGLAISRGGGLAFAPSVLRIPVRIVEK